MKIGGDTPPVPVGLNNVLLAVFPGLVTCPGGSLVVNNVVVSGRPGTTTDGTGTGTGTGAMTVGGGFCSPGGPLGLSGVGSGDCGCPGMI